LVVTNPLTQHGPIFLTAAILASGHDLVVADNFSTVFRDALIAAGSPSVIELGIADDTALSD
jgi:hypothetical protein